MAATNIAITSASTVDKAFKIRYPEAELARLFRLTSPLLAEIPKTADFVGSQQDCVIMHDHMSVGSTIGEAVDMRSHPKFKKFSVTRAAGYSFGRVENEAIAASRDGGAFKQMLEEAMESAMDGLNKWIAGQVYGNGYGVVATISSVTINTPAAGTDRILLTNKADVLKFSVGQFIHINSSATDPAAGTARGGTETYEVSQLDMDNGYVYVLGNTETTSAATTSDSIYFATTKALAGAGRYIKGLGAWIPLTAPSSGESFLGVDRSVDPTRLAGHRLADTSLPVKQAIQKLAMMIRLNNGAPDRAYMSPTQGYQLAQELGSQIVRDPGGVGLDGFDGFRFHTAGGNITCMFDPACPEDRVYVGKLSALRLSHLRGLPHFVDEDGMRARQSATSTGDFVEFALRFWGNLIVKQPAHWGVAQLTPVL